MKKMLCVALLLAGSLAARADSTVLHFRTVKDGQAGTLRVVLAPHSLLYDDGDHKVLLDFASRRRYDGERDSSLYAGVGFREAEFQNRLGLGGMLKSVKLAVPGFDVVQCEQLFSMRDPHPHPGPTVVDKPELRATFGGKVLFEASADGKKLEPTQARAYVRFLRYFTGGYPGVLAELQAEDRVPTTVTVHQFNAGKVQETRLTLVSLESSPEEPSPPVQHSWPVSKPVDSALNLAETLPPNPPDVGLANIPTLLREHQNLSAVLRAFENALCCGNALTPLITAHIAELQQDPACARFFQAVQGGATSPQASLDQMRGLEQEAGDTAFVLHVFEGGFLMQNLHQGPAGLQLYLDALNVQPRLAGAWKDVGDYYYHSYDTDTAWRCWDLGRHLAPQHSMLSSVNRLEAHLRQDYPEFF